MRQFVMLIVLVLSINFTLAFAQTNDLIDAARVGDLAAVQSLIEQEVDVNAVTYLFGKTALMWASLYGHTEITGFLIEQGADVNYAVEEGLFQGWTALMWATRRGYTETAELLIEQGADIHAVDNDGKTALMNASARGHTKTAELLIDRGADVNAVDNDAETALMGASFGGDTEIAELLIDKGADLNAVDYDGDTALDKAKENLTYHTEQLTEDPDNTDYHSEQITKLERVIGILVANDAECATTC